MRVHEVAGDRVIKQRVTGRFEGFDFGGTKFEAGVLFLMQLFTQFMGVLILQAGSIIIQKTLDARLILLENRMPCDFGAELFGLGHDGGIVVK